MSYINSEEFASELMENIEDIVYIYFMYHDTFIMFKSLTTQ